MLPGVAWVHWGIFNYHLGRCRSLQNAPFSLSSLYLSTSFLAEQVPKIEHSNLHVRLLVVFNTLISQCIAWVRFLLWSMKHFNVMTPGLPFMPIRTCTDGGLEFWHHDMMKSYYFHLFKCFGGSLSSLLCHIWAFWTFNFGVSFQRCTRSSNDARSRGQPSGSARPGRDASPRRSHRSLSPLSPPVSSRCVFHKRKCRQHKSLHLDECLTSLRICNHAWHDTPSKKKFQEIHLQIRAFIFHCVRKPTGRFSTRGSSRRQWLQNCRQPHLRKHVRVFSGLVSCRELEAKSNTMLGHFGRL